MKMNCLDGCQMRFSVDYNKVLYAFQPRSHWRQGLTQMQT